MYKARVLFHLLTFKTLLCHSNENFEVRKYALPCYFWELNCLKPTLMRKSRFWWPDWVKLDTLWGVLCCGHWLLNNSCEFYEKGECSLIWVMQLSPPFSQVQHPPLHFGGFFLFHCLPSMPCSLLAWWAADQSLANWHLCSRTSTLVWRDRSIFKKGWNTFFLTK